MRHYLHGARFKLSAWHSQCVGQQSGRTSIVSYMAGQGRRIVVCHPWSPPCDCLGWHLPQRRARSGLACFLRVASQLNNFNSVLPAAWSTCFWTGRTEHPLPPLAYCGHPSRRYLYRQDSRSLRAALLHRTNRLRARLSLRALRRFRHQASGR
jgi:hypothetical protein